MSSMLDNLSTALKYWEKDRMLKFLPILFERLPNARVYLVGGAVRDALLGIVKKKDFDIVVQGVNGKSLESTLAMIGRVDLVGKTFGVFKFLPTGIRSVEAIDIALPRRDHAYGTGGYREVDVQSDPALPIEEDLKRRDFTINAMAVEIHPQRPLSEGRLVDPFGGFIDLRDRLLRTVGDPSTRFQEDYSRLLRALRFTCQLHLTVEPTTWAALKQGMTHINDVNESATPPSDEPDRKVPYEIVTKELLKSFWWDPVLALDIFDQSGAITALMPELLAMKGCPHPQQYHSEGDVWAHTRLALQQLSSDVFQREFPDDPVTMETILGTLFHDIGKPATLTTPELHGTDRYRYHGHDKVGAQMASTICTRLKLSSMPKESEQRVSGDSIAWIVSKHLLLLNSAIEQMRSSTIEKYFFNPHVPGVTLLQVILADSLATIPDGGEPVMIHFHSMKRRIQELLKLSTDNGSWRRRGLPAPLVGGDDVMNEFHLTAGPKIGRLLRMTREQQLQGAITNRNDAIIFIRDVLTHEPKQRTTHTRHSTIPLA
ncbi:CCA tRNA nucleotidyltransferase [Candidatus Uhrbacteria bacterium]|nr:CCA tRNA nucleotidyltransferase [Candidatus Uhrbacteria bacterium]